MKTIANVTRLRVLVFCVSLLFVACVSLVGSSFSVRVVRADLMTQTAQRTTAKPAPTAPSAANQSGPTEKTVEQTQKNIQVLTGLPASQLVPVMNYMGSSLGVKCTFCHVKQGDKWDFVSDEKPEKGTAREMIKMTLELNKVNFKGRLEVSCFTCHRGDEHPARVPQLPIAAATPFADEPATAPTAPKEKPPTADQILAKYTDALGGSAAIEKLKTRSMKGTLLVPSGSTVGYATEQTADKIYAVVTSPKLGLIEKGFDGQVGWEKSEHGVRELHDPELSFFRRYLDLFKDIKLQGQFTRIGFGGKDKIDGKDVFVLRGQGVDGKSERLFFDAQTGLLLRRITSTPTMVGLIPEQVDYSDYRDVDGLKLPFTIRITSIDSFYNSTRTFTEIKVNPLVDEKKFLKPAAPATTPKP